MTETVESVLADMLAIRDDACTQAFAADCRAYPPAEQLAMARVYRSSVRDYEADKREKAARFGMCLPREAYEDAAN